MSHSNAVRETYYAIDTCTPKRTYFSCFIPVKVYHGWSKPQLLERETFSLSINYKSTNNWQHFVNGWLCTNCQLTLTESCVRWKPSKELDIICNTTLVRYRIHAATPKHPVYVVSHTSFSLLAVPHI